MEIIKAIFIFFLQYFLIRPDSSHGYCWSATQIHYPLRLQNLRLKSICLSPWDLMFKESHLIFNPRWASLDSAKLSKVNYILFANDCLGKGYMTQFWLWDLERSLLVELLRNVFLFYFWMFMCEMRIPRAAATLLTSTRRTSSHAEHRVAIFFLNGWKFFDTLPTRERIYVSPLESGRAFKYFSQ